MLFCSNLDSFGLPSFISSYNAKPVLIRQTGTLIRCVAQKRAIFNLLIFLCTYVYLWAGRKGMLKWTSTFTSLAMFRRKHWRYWSTSECFHTSCVCYAITEQLIPNMLTDLRACILTLVFALRAGWMLFDDTPDASNHQWYIVTPALVNLQIHVTISCLQIIAPIFIYSICLSWLLIHLQERWRDARDAAGMCHRAPANTPLGPTVGFRQRMI